MSKFKDFMKKRTVKFVTDETKVEVFSNEHMKNIEKYYYEIW